MIKGINGNGGVVVNGGNISWPQFYNSASTNGNTLIGQVRYNGSNQSLEVYDGTSWLHMPTTYVSVELTPDVQNVLNWARNKMSEESRMRELAAKHPTLADAIEKFKQAEEQVKIVTALVETE